VEDVEAAKFGQRGRDDGGLRGFGCAIKMDAHRFAPGLADRRSGLLRPLFTDIADHNRSALRSDPTRGRRTNPAPTARNDRDFVV
jgi:hypothetical protein